MSGGSKRTPASNRKAGGSTARSPRVAGWLTPRRLLIAACAAALAISVPVGRRWLPDLSSQPEYQVSVDRIFMTPPPDWVPEDIVQQVLSRSELGEGMSLLDETLSERIAAAFHTHPWVESVRRVHKSYPARVHVDVTWRTPVAMVEGVDGYYPVDRHAVLLPPDGFSVEDVDNFPRIIQVASIPLGAIGEAWGDPAVEGAAELAGILVRADADGICWWERLQLQAISVPSRVTLSHDEDELEFILVTKGGSRIFWGRSPLSTHPGELSVSQKLDRLTEYQSAFGGFDDAHGPYEIDIRPWQGIGRSRLAGDSRPQTSSRH